ncbi:hypothetical protein [Oricola sp.]|uniref:hypothetical protein n=1 Tax=Oricola sp. TaxID=1979950 RepID=UPI003BA98FDB
MADIYQQIWNADQQTNGIQPILDNEAGDADAGYVKVNADLVADSDPDLKVLPEVVIPDNKQDSYHLVRKLFNNYALPEAAREVDTPEERTERHAFLSAIFDAPPMRIARDYIGDRTGDANMSDERWHNVLMDHWFRTFESGGDPELSGFEHVLVGEQEGGKVQGYHFWYKYWLDDGFARAVDGGLDTVPGLSDDRIVYTGAKQGDRQLKFPESVTIAYKWNAPDYDANAVRPLHKKIGGFFVGCSAECLMALGTVRAHIGANAPKIAVIEGASYQMKVFRSPNNRHIRTFYPVFKGAADPVTDQPLPGGGNGPVTGSVRILAALVNPISHDPGKEAVTLVNTGATPIDAANWMIRDRNEKTEVLASAQLLPGVPHSFILTGDGAQLSNKGGKIRLLDPNGKTVHSVSYSRAQARAENQTLIFT